MKIGNYVPCWVVKCKTKNCKFLYLDAIAGSGKKYSHALHPVFDPFQITCPECGVEHVYSQIDLEEQNLEDPPEGFCKEFRDAIERASRERK
jgi:hypothetical protein